MKPSAFALAWWLIFLSGYAQGQTTDWSSNGDLKYRLVNTAYPIESVLRQKDKSQSTDHTLSLRYNLKYNPGAWQAEASYQLAGFSGDSFKQNAIFNDSILSGTRLPDDDARLFDLTSVISQQQGQGILHRLDRLLVGYRSDDNVIKLGRQAVSWGNGLTYTPMDIFNPFDPTAIDTEYKPGDDMLYAQHLFDAGNDLQLVWVGRRDAAKKVTSAVNSTALKYHGFAGQNEFDLLIAEHYQDTVLAVGGIVSIGGAILRGDWVYNDTRYGNFNSVVGNLSYSWMAWGKNVSGFVEYFHNDFGIADGDYSPDALQLRPELLARLQRGELFTLGKNYLAASATIEMAPLWTLTPNIFYNASDKSALWQLLSQHNLGENTQLVAALSLPIGPVGTEFGGIEVNSQLSAQASANLSTSWSLFAQFARYF